MKRLAVAVGLALVGGCSFLTVRVPDRVAPNTPLDCGFVTPRVDTVLAVVGLGVPSIVFVMIKADKLYPDPGVIGAAFSMALYGTAHAAGAVYGHRAMGRCRRLQQQQAIAAQAQAATDAVAGEAAAARANEEAQRDERRRARAWQLTQQAQERARASDCAKVHAIEAELRAVVPEWYDVFKRDRSIAACLATPANDPAVPPGATNSP